MTAFSTAMRMALEANEKESHQLAAKVVEQQQEERKRGLFLMHINSALQDFHGISGITREGKDLRRGAVVLATVWVDYLPHLVPYPGSDDGVQFPGGGYVIFWDVGTHKSWNRNTDHFDMYFGKCMSHHLRVA